MTSVTSFLPEADLMSGCGPVAAARERVSAALDGGVWSCSDRDLVEDVRETLALRAQVDALLLAQIAEVDSRGVQARRGCQSTRAWLRSAHRIAPGEASTLVVTALSLRDELPAVGSALVAGDMSLAQTQVCEHAIADLPAPPRPRSRSTRRPRRR